MNYFSILHVLGTLLIFIGVTMLAPIGCSLIYQENDLMPLIYATLATIGTGLPLFFAFRSYRDITLKDGFFIVTFGWIIVSAFSGLPFMLHGSIPSFTDAFFEMMSGYTTTGATTLTNIESLPHGLLFWRNMTDLTGGMGFIMVTIILLPLLGIGGMQLYRAEADPGQIITQEKFIPRVRESAIWLWGIYLGLVSLEALLLWGGGMSIFDSLCHSFSTLSTSGYSPKDSSIGHYNSTYFDWVITIFMFLGGTTFMVFYHIIKRDWDPIRNNTELHWYLGLVIGICLLCSFSLWMHSTYDGVLDSLRYGFFQIVSIVTTTGFTTDDYEKWPEAAKMLILLAGVIGPMAGSTGSGIKIVHFEIVLKYIYATGKKFLQPMSVVPVRINNKIADNAIINMALSYFLINIFMVFIGGYVLVLIDDLDFASALSAVMSCLFNIGPGFGQVGPTHVFHDISDAGKWFLSFNMLTGRLEMFSVIVMFYPSFWKK